MLSSVLKSFRIFNYTNTGFTGYVSSEIVYSLTRNRWEILNSHSKDTLAFMNETSKLPIGKHPWYFTHSNCVDDGKKYRTLDFHKYVVQPGHFCCDDGNCFSSEYVCDGASQCNKKEDEFNCEMIQIPSSYNKNEPPNEVFVNISIVDISTIDEDASSFDIYFHARMQWYDKRLKFQYLKNKFDANMVSKNEMMNIWVPNIKFAFIRKSFQDYETKIYIKKHTKPETVVKRDVMLAPEIYDGSGNPLLHISDHNMRFYCGFEGIADYPVDKESCSFYLYLDGPANRLTTIKSNLEPPTKTVIGQYVMSGWEIISNETFLRSRKNMLKISVSLRKKPLSIFMVTYLPTILMNIINQATNYMTGDSKYVLIITVNITSMVVLASIYLAVSTSLPSTADIKPVEIWLLFNLAYPFLVIITNVVLQVSTMYRVIQ